MLPLPPVEFEARRLESRKCDLSLVWYGSIATTTQIPTDYAYHPGDGRSVDLIELTIPGSRSRRGRACSRLATGECALQPAPLSCSYWSESPTVSTSESLLRTGIYQPPFDVMRRRLEELARLGGPPRVHQDPEASGKAFGP